MVRWTTTENVLIHIKTFAQRRMGPQAWPRFLPGVEPQPSIALHPFENRDAPCQQMFNPN